jgi:putative membrane protein
VTDAPLPLQRPALIELTEAQGEADPGLAPAVPDVAPGPVEGAVEGAVAPVPLRGGGLGRVAVWVFGALFSFALTVAAYEFVTGLLASHPVIGAFAFGLVVTAAVLAVILALREWAAFLRLGRLDRLREAVAKARAGDLVAARAGSASVAALYARREDLRWPLARLAERKAEVMDADGLLDLTETLLMTPLDQAARREIEAAARQVATITALVPMALADVAAAGFANLRMIRRMAEIYGGRSGTLGSWRLLRRVFTHLVATGAVALTDDLIGSVAGGGLLGKLSRRFGEGLVNGALTARVGVAAMELCRPMPFQALPRPTVTNLVGRALGGLFDRAATGGGGAGLPAADLPEPDPPAMR